jgi:Protein of unknown function (DUF3102)
MTGDLTRSNSLTDLAARIKTEHEATVGALKRSVEHAMAAGVLLIEAKAQLKHGQWLPWLSEHCAMSERTARLFMRIARNKSEIERIGNVADLSLRGAVALISLQKNYNGDVVNLADGVAEIADTESVIAAYETSHNERARRAVMFAECESALAQIIELGSAQPAAHAAAESIWQELGDELMTAISSIKPLLEAENEPFAVVPQATLTLDKARNLCVEMLADVERVVIAPWPPASFPSRHVGHSRSELNASERLGSSFAAPTAGSLARAARRLRRPARSLTAGALL